MGQETFERDGITVFGGRMDATNALVLVFFRVWQEAHRNLFL